MSKNTSKVEVSSIPHEKENYLYFLGVGDEAEKLANKCKYLQETWKEKKTEYCKKFEVKNIVCVHSYYSMGLDKYLLKSDIPLETPHKNKYGLIISPYTRKVSGEEKTFTYLFNYKNKNGVLYEQELRDNLPRSLLWAPFLWHSLGLHYLVYRKENTSQDIIIYPVCRWITSGKLLVFYINLEGKNYKKVSSLTLPNYFNQVSLEQALEAGFTLS